jgi:DNA-directed RNA polymerase subunit beta'
MAYLNPAEASEHFQSRVVEAIKSQFPVTGKTQTLTLDHIEVKDDLDPDDIRAQQKAKVGGETWAVPVFAHLTLKDNVTGRTIDSKKIRICEIPKMTRRYSYILAGPTGAKEYQVDNQWQLKPGVYTKRRRNGELESRVNVSGRSSFDVVFHPDKKTFEMEYGASKAKLPLYPVLKTLGVNDADMLKSWGKEIYEANKDAKRQVGVSERLYKTIRKTVAPSKEAADENLFATMEASKVRPDATQETLGKSFYHVTGELLHKTTEKLLKVQSGHPEDDRDSLLFKMLRTTGDYAHDQIMNAKRIIASRTARQINKATNIRDIVKFDLFNEPIREVFRSAASRTASQINPVEMVSSSQQTTVMGPGGIQSEQAVNDEAKFVNPSHLGFLDPIHTPEGEKTGVTLRLPIGVRKVGEEPRISLYNLKTHKSEDVSPATFLKSNVVLADQVKWEGGKPAPLHTLVRVASQGNELADVKFGDAQYVMVHPSQMFNMTSNLIPFLGNTSGNRAAMASRQMEQAISLVHRQAPLVQVSSGVSMKGYETFENLLGRSASHPSPVAGKVVEVKKDGIVIEGPGGKKEVQIYDNYPLNDPKSVMHSTPLVKVGDTVHKGQIIADTNFSDKGTLALGTNLRVAYLPYKGYNFEDGIVISESARDKLSSAHLHKESIPVDKTTVLGKKSFHTKHPGLYTRQQFGKVDDGGVVRVGQIVEPGDPLILATKPFALKDRVGLGAIRRSMSNSHTDQSLRWDSDFPGEVVEVHHGADKVTVHVRTIEPMQVGDKMAGRYGNKGIVTQILPDKDMPHTRDGKHIEVALNPSGVPGRMNVGQLLETAAGKIAEKTGKTYHVINFEPGVDQLAKVKRELAENGLTDTEELIDPLSKESLGKVMIGPQHMIKLVHQVDKKLSVRSGLSVPGSRSSEHYDLNLQPSSGGGTGGQSMGVLGMYAMLAHGAKANIREMQTYKSEGQDPTPNADKRWPSQHNQVWAAIMTGSPIPTPKPTFAWRKFEDMLRGAGINMEKQGHHLILSPLTDKQIIHLAPNALTKPADMLRAKVTKEGEFKPMPGGLFDDKLTGGHQGRKWSRIELAEPLPNPVFESAIQRLTGLKRKDYASIVAGERAVTPGGELTDLGGGLTGGEAIESMLKKIDVKKELVAAKKELNASKGTKIDRALKKVKYLQALDQLGMTPNEAYILHNLPVLPPAMRPVSVLPDGNIKYSDVNGLYSEFAKINDRMKAETYQKHLTDPLRKDARREYYDGVKALMGVGIPYGDVKQHGLLHQIAGSQPKTGYFQETLMNRRQDLTMRSTIVPEPALGLDEVGLPKHAALELFKPFVTKKLYEMGAIALPMGGDAQALIDKKSPVVWTALQRVMEERPVLLKRDPALHKYSVQAFNAKIAPGNAVQIHPLVTGGYNADFDGDTMSVFVPIHPEAVAEAKKMYPSVNLLSESTGRVVYAPTLESALGVYKLSLVGKDVAHIYKHSGEAVEAVRSGKIKVNDVVHIGREKTTPGRILLASVLPEPMQKAVLHDLDKRLDRKGLGEILSTLAKDHGDEYGTVVNKLKDLGNQTAFGVVSLPSLVGHDGDILHFGQSGHPFRGDATIDKKQQVFIPVGAHTLGLDDFTPDTKVRGEVLGAARKKVDTIYGEAGGTKADKDRRAIAIWNTADLEMKKQHLAGTRKNPSNLMLMHDAGVKPDWNQYKQMVLAPMLFEDSAKRTLPTPVTKSYSEGLDVGGYWDQMPGARRGAVMKVQEVQEPGYMSKLLMNNMMNLVVNNHDCGTKRGISMGVDESDVHDRQLAQDFTQGKLHIPAGTSLTPDIVGKIRAAKKDAKIVVRSPLKCEEPVGICQACLGLSSSGSPHPLGTNIGVISAHTVGERAVQLTLKSFHTGGVAEHGGGLLSQFARFQQLMDLHKTIPNAASLAMVGGKIDRIEKQPTGVDIYINGQKHFVGKDFRGLPLNEELAHTDKHAEGYAHWTPPVTGLHVEAGQHLSDPNRTVVNPHDLYKATGSIDKVQNHLASEIFKLYKREGIKRRAVEVLVKSMTNLTKVHDPGDHPTVLRGEFRPLSVVQRMNTELVKDGKHPIEHEPVIKGVEAMPLSVQEDWMAKLQHQELRETLTEAAANHGVANIHGLHPVPGIAFGAEFGLTSKDSKKPGFGHLSNVPAHNY